MRNCDQCGRPVAGPGSGTVPPVHPACLVAWRARKWPLAAAALPESIAWCEAVAGLLGRLADEVGGLSEELASVAALELNAETRAAVTEAIVAAEKMRQTVAAFRARIG